MHSYCKYAASVLLFLAGCTQAAVPTERPALTDILHQAKFVPRGDYRGADTPEDREPLQQAVDGTIEDIGLMPDPLDKEAVRARLSDLLDETNLYATEDRDEVGRYAIRIWRALGFKEETGLFAVPDDDMLR